MSVSVLHRYCPIGWLVVLMVAFHVTVLKTFYENSVLILHLYVLCVSNLLIRLFHSTRSITLDE